MKMERYDVVIQGGWWPSVLDNAECYAQQDFIDRVIISTWEDAPVTTDDISDDSITLIKNKYPEYIGPGNLNLHLKSALTGIDATTSEMVIKLRSDQKIFDYSFKKMYDFYEKHKDEPTIKYLDGTRHESKIFITGIGTHWSYHPQDHTFWGHKKDIRRVFDIPFSDDPPLGREPIDFSISTENFRNPIYIGAHYYAQFYPEAREHLKKYKKYLLDGSPDFRVALEFYLSVKETIFKPFPKIDLWWEKYNMEYKYDLYEPQGEYCSNDDIQ
jgi:hypothetical protein